MVPSQLQGRTEHTTFGTRIPNSVSRQCPVATNQLRAAHSIVMDESTPMPCRMTGARVPRTTTPKQHKITSFCTPRRRARSSLGPAPSAECCLVARSIAGILSRVTGLYKLQTVNRRSRLHRVQGGRTHCVHDEVPSHLSSALLLGSALLHLPSWRGWLWCHSFFRRIGGRIKSCHMILGNSSLAPLNCIFILLGSTLLDLLVCRSFMLGKPSFWIRLWHRNRWIIPLWQTLELLPTLCSL
mmetsp:Transcript_2007/g.7185  ORF Transcript_2007/g.7185 Transcript_2007/m.7185 type:complete len:241 (+) Transcript_2007:982-1704(+)